MMHLEYSRKTWRGTWGRAWLVPMLLAIALSATAQDSVVVVRVTGVIDEGISIIVKRAVKEAEDRGAKALILRVDTPGGRVDSAIQIATAVQEAEVPTIAFIEGMGAISAGALISFSCDSMVMTPGTNIGAATPVIPTAEGMLPTSEKEVSFVRAKMRALAESNGYNPDVAQAMVDKDIELRGFTQEDGSLRVYGVTHEPDEDEDKGRLVDVDKRPKSAIERIFEATGQEFPLPTELPGSKKSEPEAPAEVGTVVQPGTIVFEDGSELLLPRGKLLTLTPNEAIRYGLIPETIASLDELIDYYDFGSVEVIEIVPTWSEGLFRWLTSPTIAGLLMLLAIGGLYFEVQAPGFGFPGILGLTCLALFLGSHFVVGLADVIELVLILAGLLLIALEMFVIPGFGLAGVAGTLSVAVGLYLSLVNFTVPRYSWEFDRLWEVAYSLTITSVLFVVFAGVMWRVMPRTGFYGRLMLAGTQDVAAGYIVQTNEQEAEAIGLEGVVSTSMLRPAGKGRFGMKTYDIVSRGEYLSRGTPIVIVEVEGNRYVVDPLPEEKS